MKNAIFAIFVILLFITGCAGIRNKIPTSLPGLNNQDEEPAVYGGTGSITATIMHPKEGGTVMGGYSFEPVVRIENKGGAESEGQVCLSGLDPEIFSGFGGCDCLSFQQASEEGLFEPENLKFGPYSIANADTASEYTITSVSRYSYGTNIQAEICVAEDMYETENCNANIVSATSGPLVVDSIEESIIPLKDRFVTIIFKINVRKAVDGSLINPEDVHKECSPVSTEKDKEKLIKAGIGSFPIGGDITCSDAKLDENDEASINCEARDVALYDAGGNSLFKEGYRPEIRFEIEYAFETRDSSRFKIG